MQRSLSELVAFLRNNLEVNSACGPAMVQILPVSIRRLCKVGGLTPFYGGSGTVSGPVVVVSGPRPAGPGAHALSSCSLLLPCWQAHSFSGHCYIRYSAASSCSHISHLLQN